MRILPLITRTVAAAAVTLLALLAAPGHTAPIAAKPAPSSSAAIWSQAVNERTGYMRQAVASYPWAEQSEQLRRHSEDADHEAADGTEQEVEVPPERISTPDTEPIFVTNPAGPVNCAEVRCVALTFDDGPVPNTRKVLAALSEVGARASFFMTGQMATAHPEIAAEVAAAGHELGNHGWSHTDFTELSEGELRSELSRTAVAIESATGWQPSMARPPYGSLTSQVSQAAEGPMIMWSTDSRDWQHRSAAHTHQQVIDTVEPGAIVLLHDLEASTAEATPLILRDLLAKGYHVVTVSEILGHSGEPGQVYSSGLRP
ncbi:polysaccharide deacetylase family protein [Nesterenkonia muleiensis]|uniref:polysaccharide deacetylase family protein n=1 Tax=Nesterenkonia muleiensis TaxID=2282648 RepID=UPI000E75ABDC|nr:polysaccharide deacetylase family protein [Nesterenkonia muleiensis]